jgi:hypothetical protein
MPGKFEESALEKLPGLMAGASLVGALQALLSLKYAALSGTRFGSAALLSIEF